MKPWTRRFIVPLKAAAVVLVLAAVAWHVRKLVNDWSQQGGSLDSLRLNPWWLVASAATYLLAQFSFGAFWRVLLRALAVEPSWWELFRAYCIGTLGKYIPGKAMVVVIRTGMIPKGSVGRFPVALSVFFETTTAMMMGCAVACLCLAPIVPGAWVFWGGAGAVAAAIIVGLSPPFFTRAIKLASLPFAVSPISREAVAEWFAALRRPIVLYSAAGWVLFGASFWAVMYGMGAACATFEDFAFLTGVTALATAGGFFFVFLPSGIGIRELIIIQLLASRYGQSQAVIASLLLRTVWTLAEVALAGVFYLMTPASRRAAAMAVADDPY
ncbi:MAG: lysylphosphatidylglycerol synthase transmembrane domain-containing protein [Planctomycetota bacterium]